MGGDEFSRSFGYFRWPLPTRNFPGTFVHAATGIREVAKTKIWKFRPSNSRIYRRGSSPRRVARRTHVSDSRSFSKVPVALSLRFRRPASALPIASAPMPSTAEFLIDGLPRYIVRPSVHFLVAKVSYLGFPAPISSPRLSMSMVAAHRASVATARVPSIPPTLCRAPLEARGSSVAKLPQAECVNIPSRYPDATNQP